MAPQISSITMPSCGEQQLDSKKLQDLMISFHVSIVVVSSKHVWYKVKAARLLLL
jgi:hypothetical protein